VGSCSQCEIIWVGMGSIHSSFNVTLFSNSFKKDNPNSTIGAITVQKAHEIDLGSNT
jgi:hypothetical protein